MNSVIKRFASTRSAVLFGRSKLPEDTLPFHFFIRKQQSRELYRSLVRLCNKIQDKDIHRDVLYQIRQSYKLHKNVKDVGELRSLIAEGNRYKQQIASMANTTSSSDNKTGDVSWMDTDDPEDRRGRVGTGWPWQ